jgi:uncharacterized protein (DUF983 family)
MPDDSAHYPPVDPIKAGLRCRCPRCGEGKLFDGLVKVRPACSRCGLDYAFIDAGDGPAIFVILIVSLIVMGLALWLEFNYHPPVLLHIVLWGPLTIGLCLVLMRSLKGVLIDLQYHHNAREGRIDRG